MRSQLFQRRFVIVSGKGGVGRSTVSAALGIIAARYGLRTCVVQLNTRDDIGAMFSIDADSYEPVALDPRTPLFATMLRPAPALREYGLMKLRWKALQSLVFDNEVMRRLLAMVPGMNELVLLGKAWYMEEQQRTDSLGPFWDLLVIDAPATGHGVSLLRLPQVILDAVPVGPMAEDARHMRDLLADPRRTALHVVTLPQELPATEALELADQARNLLAVPTGYMFVNQVLPALLSDSLRIRAQQAALYTQDPLAKAALYNVHAYEQWRGAQQEQVRHLQRASALPLVELPHLFRPIGRAELDHLAEVAEAGMEGADARRQAIQPQGPR